MTLAATLSRLRAIVAAPLHRRLGQGGAGGLWFFVGFVLSIPAALLVLSVWHHEAFWWAMVMLLVMSGFLALAWWVGFVASLSEQAALPTSPLVPGHRRHLALALWSAAGALTLAFGAGWGVVAHRVVAPSVITFAVLGIVAGFMRLRFVGLAAFVLVVILANTGQGLWLADAVAGKTAADRLHGAIALAIALVIGAVLLAWATPTARRRTRPRGAVPADALVALPCRLDRPPSSTASDAAPVVDRQAAEIARLPTDPLRRALSALPLRLHGALAWRGPVLSWMALASIALLAPIRWLSRHGDLAFDVLLFMTVARFIDQANALGSGLAATRREQHLVVLMPGVPRGTGGARALARWASARLLFRWAVGLCGLLVLRTLVDLRDVALMPWNSPASIVALAASCLPLLALAWRDWSRAAPPGGWAAFGPLLGVALPWGAALGLAEWAGVSTYATSGGYVAATALWVAWRRGRMAVEPFPLPFGRRA